MLRNYIVIAYRNLTKKVLYSFINAVGLSIAICFSVLIGLYIHDEQSFDSFHKKKSRIYRVESNNYDSKQPDSKDPYRHLAWLPTALCDALKEELPEVEKGTRFNADGQGVVRYQDKVFIEPLTFVDNDFFQMFSFSLLEGNQDKVFSNKTDAVITSSLAKKYFENDSPLGKQIAINQTKEIVYTIVGVIENPPANSSLDFQILLPQENRLYYQQGLNNWGNFNTPTFVLLKDNVNLKTFSENLQKVKQRYLGEKMVKWREESSVPAGIEVVTFTFTELGKIHYSNKVDWHEVSNPEYGWILGGIAALIILIAAINYTSLALTSSASRSLEVGVRKSFGASRWQLFTQFTAEAVLVVFVSMILGILMIALFLPMFNQFANKSIELTAGLLFLITLSALVVSLVIGFISSCYPSLFLSSVKPINALKGFDKIGFGFAKPLTILQFSISSFLLISSIAMYRQMNFISKKDLGFEKENIISIPTQKGWGKETDQVVDQFRTRLKNQADVISVSGTSMSPSKGLSRINFKDNNEEKYAFSYSVDPDFVPALGIDLIEGRNFNENIVADRDAVIVNESLVRQMNWSDPLASYLNYKGDTTGRGAKVIGVVKDYHFGSLEVPIEPMFFNQWEGSLRKILVKISDKRIPETIQSIKTAWTELYPDMPFEYSFIEDDVNSQYQSYERWTEVVTFSSFFAIVISCLGLFGLTGINAVNKTKEIGIRKVMGAGVRHIFVLLNKQYILLSIASFAIALPFSWIVMNKWLSSFSYHITMEWQILVLSSISVMATVLATVSYHAIKASSSNPAETLKYE